MNSLLLILASLWCVTPCPHTDGVWWLTGAPGEAWSFAADSDTPESNGDFCWEIDINYIGGGSESNLTFIIAIAYNEFGFSSTEHGEYAGWGYEPEIPCNLP